MAVKGKRAGSLPRAPRGVSHRPKTPRQASIPGMEDREIEELQAAGEHYASIRDRRMKLTEEEVELKKEVRTLMIRHGKKTYRFGKVEIDLVPGEEKVKVKIHKDESDEESDE
jgi:hypothetical protein